MKIEYLNNYALMSKRAASIIYSELNSKPNLLLCAASGRSPIGVYECLVDKYKSNPSCFGQLRLIKLDEWGGISMDNPHTCESFLQKRLVNPLGITPCRYISFNSDAPNAKEECSRIAFYLLSKGPIDLCVLGLGLNGHIAFNEPGQYLLPYCHTATLSKKTLKHPMAKHMGCAPTYGLTLGMKDLLQARKIIMLITGEGKAEIIRRFLSGKISTDLPASFLWLHNNINCFINT